MAMTIDGLRLLQVVALRGSLSAAAADLGYTQSGVSRQLAVLENATGQRLVDRGAFGARLTPAGRRLLPHADAVIQAVSAAERAALGETSTPAYRLGLFISAGATLLPRTLHALTDIGWDRTLRTIDGTSPMLIRAVLSGRLDGAVVVSRPPFRSLDDGSGRLHEHEIGVMELRVAVSQSHPLGHRMDLRIADLSAAAWADSASPGSDPVLGVWPGLDHRAEIRYRTTDWLTKLQLVAHGLAVTTVPPLLADALPRNTLMLEVTDVPPELRWVRLVTAVDRPAPDPLPNLLADAFTALTSETD
ncbi:LysR family transcriptional regulator [Glaciibacter flavus]|uniref:LysR family transcriptional regulator n=1 Tax=Orlajensenia flava TaxID=2565934 RepID=A0A4S4FTP6_9MICO|nr:LysR family transcriptional regulator [Glaciibacter flavus]THG34033.1 LysR family transcriptional regulator [Glaciibacter flavus]